MKSHKIFWINQVYNKQQQEYESNQFTIGTKRILVRVIPTS